MNFDHERRALGRRRVSAGALLVIPGIRGIHSCALRDISQQGASLRLNGIKVLATEFWLSLDGLHTTLACRLVWRDDDFVGVRILDKVGGAQPA